MIRDIDDDRVLERHLALIPVISQYDVIFMQEVVPETWDTIKEEMPNYLHFEGFESVFDQYFVTISIKKEFCAKIEQNQYIPFSGSMMGRGLLSVELTDKLDQKWTFMTSHLESTKVKAQTRNFVDGHRIQILIRDIEPAFSLKIL